MSHYFWRSGPAKFRPVHREEFIVAEEGHPVSVKEAIALHPDLPPLVAIGRTHRTIGEVLADEAAPRPRRGESSGTQATSGS